MAIFEAEVGQLTESQALTQEEWTNKTSHLESELNQATAQKVDMVASATVFVKSFSDSYCTLKNYTPMKH